MPTLGRAIAMGALWMVTSKFVVRGLGLVSTVILARILLPQDFGLVAMATTVIVVLEILNAVDFDAALIQKRDAGPAHYDTAWTLQILFAALTAVLLLALAYPAVLFYGEPRLQAIVQLLALATLVGGFRNIGVVEFRKKLQFDKEFTFQVANKFVAFLVTIFLAFYLRSYWALVWGILAQRSATLLTSYFLHPYRPTFTLQAWRELLGFSAWMAFNGFLISISYRAADFVVGRISGAREIGLYSLSLEVAELPTTELAQPINRAVFPGYSKISGDLVRLRQAYLDVVGMIALLTLPAAFGIAAVAEVMVPVVLGQNWLDAVPIIQVLAFSGAVKVTQTNIASVYLSLGRPHILVIVTATYVLVLVPTLIFMTSTYGVLGAAWANLLTGIVLMPLVLYLAFRTLELKVLAFIRVTWRPIVSSSLTFFAVHLLISKLGVQQDVGANSAILLGGVLLGVVTYAASVMTLWALSGRPVGSEQHVFDAATSRFRRFQRGA